MTTPFLIAQISDPHIKRPGELAYGVVDTAAALKRCIAHINAMNPLPALVVCSGDLVDGGSAEEYAHLKALLGELRLPFYAVPGNHDAREPMRSAFPGQPYAAPGGALNMLVRAGGLDLVLLDSSVPGQPYGLLEDATLDWLDTLLKTEHERPAMIFLHHPPFITGITHMDRQNLRNAAAFAEVLERHSRVKQIACGHVHRATLTAFAGVPTTICPAPNHAVDLDLAQLRRSSFRVEPPAFHLHAWFGDAPQGSLVTHLVPIGEFAGPYPFFSDEGKLL